jgi:hypothetical protein
VELHHLALLLALPGAMLSPPKHEDHGVVTLELGELVLGARVIE